MKFVRGSGAPSYHSAGPVSLQRLIASKSRLPPLPPSGGRESNFIEVDTFVQHFLSRQKPGYFPGLVSKASPFSWPATGKWQGTEWVMGGLKANSQLQHSLVDVEISRTGRGYGDNVRQELHQGFAQSIEQDWSHVKMPYHIFHEAFIEETVPWNGLERDHSSRFDDPPYAAYVAQQDLFEQVDAFAADCPHLLHALAGKRVARNVARRNVWIGSRGTFTPIHRDPYHNLFAQIIGTKRIHIFPPRTKDFLHLFDANTRQPNTSQIPTELPLLTRQIDTGDDAESAQIGEGRDDEDDPGASLAFWPDLQSAISDEEAYCVTVNPGDVVYIPLGWYHCVSGLTATASVNTWFNYSN